MRGLDRQHVRDVLRELPLRLRGSEQQGCRGGGDRQKTSGLRTLHTTGTILARVLCRLAAFTLQPVLPNSPKTVWPPTIVPMTVSTRPRTRDRRASPARCVPARGRWPSSFARGVRRGDDRLRERQFGVGHVVAHGFVHPQRAAGDRAVFGAHDAAFDVIARTGRRHVVGREHDAVAAACGGEDRPSPARRGGRRRSAARACAVLNERREDRRIAMIERRHRVERVRERAKAQTDREHAFAIARGRMSGRTDDAVFEERRARHPSRRRLRAPASPSGTRPCTLRPSLARARRSRE